MKLMLLCIVLIGACYMQLGAETQKHESNVNDIVVGGIYRHYKNKNYKIIGIARHSESLEELVVYQALYDAGGSIGKDALWVRPKHMFLEAIELDGKIVTRFTLISQ